MPQDVKREDLVFDGSVKVNNKGEAILGRLCGPVAEFIAPTRNGRMYDEETWDKVFKSPLVKEMFEAGGLLGELNHPEDRLETDLSKVCVCMPEPPTKNNDGCLTATFDILDTPNGRIVETLAKYGYKLGVSSRADGETFEGYDGNSHVDPDSFDLKAFDIVLLPAVKKARLSLQESLNSDIKTALKECLDKASSSDKQIMLESLNSLHINVQDTVVPDVKDSSEAVDDGAELITQLQEALKSNRDLEKQLGELQEKLSVCYAKEAKQEADISKYRSSIVALSDSAKAAKCLKDKNVSLQEQLRNKEQLIEEKDKQLSLLTEAAKVSVSTKKQLKESVDKASSELSTLNESFEKFKKSAADEKSSLLENIEEMKKDSEIKSKQYSEKLKKSNELIEHYRSVAKKSVDKYIDLKATMIGVTSQEIKNKLNEGYSFNEIDRVCENLQSYKLNISKLPFDIKRQNAKMVVTESVEPIRPKTPGIDDEIDDNLLRMAGLN